jgi:hypothetical protein
LQLVEFRRVAEISHSQTCNFFLAHEFKYIGDSEKKDKRLNSLADPGFCGEMADLRLRGIHHALL